MKALVGAFCTGLFLSILLIRNRLPILIAGGIIASLISGMQTPDAPVGGSDPDTGSVLPSETPRTMVLEPTPTLSQDAALS